MSERERKELEEFDRAWLEINSTDEELLKADRVGRIICYICVACAIAVLVIGSLRGTFV